MKKNYFKNVFIFQTTFVKQKTRYIEDKNVCKELTLQCLMKLENPFVIPFLINIYKNNTKKLKDSIFVIF